MCRAIINEWGGRTFKNLLTVVNTLLKITICIQYHSLLIYIYIKHYIDKSIDQRSLQM